MHQEFRVFVQARMSSRRFPGKVLAPLCGKPVICHVLDRVTQAIIPAAIVVATSTATSDDPLVAYVKSLGFDVFRGDLDNVIARFQQCLSQFPCQWLFRICADSPALDPGLLRAVRSRCVPGIDLVTNVQERTFPPGQSVECMAANRFAAIDSQALAPEEREHVTQYYYRHSKQFSILNLRAAVPATQEERFVVDTLDDLRRLEAIIAGDSVPGFSARILETRAA
jgi:spore coat polysaccharide biosynthesis protein SpsF